MLSFRIHLPFALMAVVVCAGLNADEPGPTLKELISEAFEKPTTDTAEAVRWAMSYHASARMANESRLLVVSWFRNNVQSLLRYSVSETGDTHSRRTQFNSGTQATEDATLPADQL